VDEGACSPAKIAREDCVQRVERRDGEMVYATRQHENERACHGEMAADIRITVMPRKRTRRKGATVQEKKSGEHEGDPIGHMVNPAPAKKKEILRHAADQMAESAKPDELPRYPAR